jgi:PIN domain nuclease of toxin-antitoxin system
VIILLDTHVLLWLLNDPDRVPFRIMTRVENTANDVMFSPINIFEVATKARLGRSDFPFKAADVYQAARLAGLREAPLRATAAMRAGDLAWDHRDPFDRLLMAQALDEDAALATVDARMLAYRSVVQMIVP